MPSSTSVVFRGFFLTRKRRTWDGANKLVTAAGRALSEGRARLRLLPFVFADGNIASEDSSLSDALVLEDGRSSVSCLRAGGTDETGVRLWASSGAGHWKGRSQEEVAAGSLAILSFFCSHRCGGKWVGNA